MDRGSHDYRRLGEVNHLHVALIPENTLEDSNIDVDILNGAVTLKGTVKSEAGRARAVAIAKGTAGAKSVNDALKIG